MIATALDGSMQHSSFMHIESSPIEFSYYHNESASDEAAKNGQMWCPADLDLAAEEGRLEDLKSLYVIGCGLSTNAYFKAKRFHHYDVMVWVRDLKTNELSNRKNEAEVESALIEGRFEDLRALYAKGFYISRSSWDTAVDAGDNIAVLDLLHSSGVEFPLRYEEREKTYDKSLMHYALRKGRFATVRWLHEVKGCPLSSAYFNSAIIAGNFGFLKWLRTVGCPYPEDPYLLCSQAAWQERLDILEWLVGIGCKMRPEIASIVSARGNIEMLKWVVNNTEGFQWSARCVAEASRNGHLEMLKFLLENGCPMSNNRFGTYSKWDDWSAMARAAGGGHWHVVQWLVEQGYELSISYSLIADACAQKNLDALQWLVQLGYPWDARSCLARCEKLKFSEAVDWITTRYPPLRAPQSKHTKAGQPKKTAKKAANGPATFTCSRDTCNETFDSVAKLNKHMKTMHSVRCPLCNCAFALPEHVLQHITTSHT